MPFVPLTKAERADWQQLLAPTDGARLGSAAILFALSSLAIPFSLNHMVALLFVLYAAIFYYALCRSMPAVLLAALPAILLFGISGMFVNMPSPFTLPAIYAAALWGGVSGAFLMVQCRTPKRFFPLAAIPVGAYLITTLVTGDPFRALFALIPTGLALIISYAFLSCRPLNSTVLLLAGAVAAVAVISWLVTLVLTGWPEINPLLALVEELRTGIHHLLKETAMVYAAQGLDFTVSDVAVHNLVAMLGNILPGLFLAACILFAWGSWRIFLRMIASWGTLPRIPARLGAMTVSAVTAALFTLCYFVSLFGGASVTVFGTVCQNLSLVLQLPLVLVGFTSLFSRQPQQRSCLSSLFSMALIVLFVFNPAAALSLTALVGAFHVLLARFLPQK